MENGNSTIEYPGCNGISNHKNRVIKNEKTGDKKNINTLEFDVYNISLPINFKASAKGCNKPNIPTIFGPLLRCTLLITFRSSKVKNAIHKITKINVIKLLASKSKFIFIIKISYVYKLIFFKK
jgi:hypothetical protein